jgi:hypothetical protein
MFIHEGFLGFEARFYLAVVVKNEENVVGVFPVGSIRAARIPLLTCPASTSWSFNSGGCLARCKEMSVRTKEYWMKHAGGYSQQRLLPSHGHVCGQVLNWNQIP